MDLLEKPDVSDWMLTNEKFLGVLEYLLWDQFRTGISSHCAEATPCILIECDMLMTMIRQAMGSHFYKEVQFMAKLNETDASVEKRVALLEYKSNVFVK